MTALTETTASHTTYLPDTTVQEPDALGNDTGCVWRRNARIRFEVFCGHLSAEEKQAVAEAVKVLYVQRSAVDTTCNTFFPETSNAWNSWSAGLYYALCDMRDVAEEAREEAYPVPSDLAFRNADRLLKAIYVWYPRRFEVYPTPDGEIAIHAHVPSEKGSSVLLLCDSAGGARCLVNVNGTCRRARYANTETLPDGFVREALAEISLLQAQTE